MRALWRTERGKPEGRVLIPIRRPGHWVFVRINLTAQQLEHYDSCYRSAAKAAGELQTTESLLKQLRGDDTLLKEKLRELTLEELTGRDIPQQYELNAPDLDKAGVDCVVFTIFYALSGLPTRHRHHSAAGLAARHGYLAEARLARPPRRTTHLEMNVTTSAQTRHQDWRFSILQVHGSSIQIKSYSVPCGFID